MEADDFATVTLPERDCDAIRDLLIAARAGTVIEIGLALGTRSREGRGCSETQTYQPSRLRAELPHSRPKANNHFHMK